MLRVIELFSGVGGMHYALQDSGIDFEVVAAADINTLANSVYKFNVPHVNILQTNIQSFTAKFLNNMDPDMIVMSPPCQPFTRVGLKKDADDARTCPLLKFITLLPELTSKLKFILLENVQGFELSHTRTMLIEALSKSNFNYQEFLLSPTLFNIPNSRTRYYLMAKRTSHKFAFDTSESIMEKFPVNINFQCRNPSHEKLNQTILNFLEVNDDSESYVQYLVPEKDLDKRVKVFDIVTKSDNRSLCFTKAYTHYAEGTGSVYCPFDRKTISDLYEKSKNTNSHEERLSILNEMRLRYFTPKEVANLMCFPDCFQLPNDVTNRQGYRLLGNSINIHVVGKLIRLMCLTVQDTNR